MTVAVTSTMPARGSAAIAGSPSALAPVRASSAGERTGGSLQVDLLRGHPQPTTDGDLEEATWLAFLSTHIGPPKWRSKHTPTLSRR
jgi:hypothetical protein